LRFHLKEGITDKLIYAPKKIKLLTILIMVYYFGWAIIEPFFPLYLNTIFNSYSNIGIVMSSVYLFSILTGLFFGQIINRVSKKTMISIALFLYLPLSFIILGITRLPHFIFFQVYHAVIKTPLWISSEAYIRKNTTKKRVSEALGTFYSGYGLALVIGPIIGAFLIYKIGFSIFYSISFFAFIAFIISFFLPRENRESILKGIKNSILKDGFVIKEFKHLFRNQPLKFFLIFMFFYYFSIYHLFMIVPLFLEKMNISFLNIGLIYSLFFVPLTFESFFSKLKNKKRAIVISLFLSSIVLLAMFFIKSLIAFFFLIFIMGTMFSIINPLLRGRVTYFMPRKEFGEMGGVEYSVINLAAFLSFLIAGFISEIYSLNMVFLLSSILVFSLFLFTLKNKSLFA